MALLGKAAIAMWWDIAPDMLQEFQDWHSHEHFRERLAIPGFRRATRWRCADGGDGVFQVYELDEYQTLWSAPYLAHLNAPTPWSTKLMPHHRNMVRSLCRVLESSGGTLARYALTVRLSPAASGDESLRKVLKGLTGALADRPGCVGGHLLRHESPPIDATAEEKIRGGDGHADWVFVAVGYDEAMVRGLAVAELAPEMLVDAGALPGAVASLYALCFSATSADVV